MWKMVLSDLRCGFWPGFKRILKRLLYLYFIIYFYGFLPQLFHLSGRGLLHYCAGMLPMFLAMLLSGIYGCGGNKVLYLCPLSEEDRKRYFLVSFAVRAGIPPFLSLLLEGLFLALGLVGLSTALLALLTVLFFSAAMSMYGGFMDWGAAGAARFKMPSGYAVWGSLILLLGICTMVFLMAVVGDVEEPRYNGPETIFMLLLFFAHLLAVLCAFVKYFRLLMERMAHYEH